MTTSDESPRIRWYRARTKAALGSALQSIRRAAGDTQDDAAARFGSSRPHLSRLERGTTPQLDTLLDYMDGYSYEIVLVPRGSTVTVNPAR